MNFEEFIKSSLYHTYKTKINKDKLPYHGFINEIQYNIGSIIDKSYKNVLFFKTKETMIIFKFNNSNIIFKLSTDNNAIKTRYKNLLYGKYIIDFYNLDLLYIPDAVIFTINNNENEYILIVEEYLKLLESKNGDHYKLYVNELDDTIRQMTKFICKTNFCDVDYRNIPLIDENFKKDNKLCKRIALIDLEDFYNADYGIFGRVRAKGLLRCIKSLKQFKIVESEAIENGIDVDRYGYDIYDVKTNYINY